MDNLKRITKGIANYFNWVACVALFAIMLVTVVDVIGRSFGRPIFGAYDLVCMLAVVAFSFALAYTQIMKNHIGVDFLVSRLSSRTQGIIEVVVYGASISLAIVFAWRSAILARSLWISGEATMTMQLPQHFFVYGIGLACLPFCLVFFIDLLDALEKVRKK